MGEPKTFEGKCAMCKAGYIEPKILPCIHTFCKKCLLNGVRAASRHSAPFSCPLCKSQHILTKEKINSLQDNHFVGTLPDLTPRNPPVMLNHQDNQPTYTTTGRKRPVSSVGRFDLSPRPEMRRFKCAKHPSGSVYCKTCEVYSCLMCKNNKEHRGHELVEAADFNSHDDESDEELTEDDAIFFAALQQQHLTGQTEEVCRRAMHVVRDEASSLMEDINQRAADVIRKIEEEKLMLLKNLTLAEAQKLQTIRRALECANKIARVQKKNIQSRQLPEPPTEASGLENKTRKVLELEDSLRGLGITFTSYGHVRPVLGELNKLEERVELRAGPSRPNLENRHTVADVGVDSEGYTRTINRKQYNGGNEHPEHGQTSVIIGTGDEQEREEAPAQVNGHDREPSPKPKPRPAHRKLQRLHPINPVEHRPLPPTPAPRTLTTNHIEGPSETEVSSNGPRKET